MNLSSALSLNEAANLDSLHKALTAHKLKNNDKKLSKLDIEELLSKNKFKSLLSINTDTHSWAYRFIDLSSEKQLGQILDQNFSGQQRAYNQFFEVGGGVLNPKDGADGISSWTVNPRSLIYSGFFSVLPKARPGLVLFKAKISHKDNLFFGNPDDMSAELGLENGYGLEREVMAIGPVVYEKAVYGFVDRKTKRTLEGLGMDLTNLLWPLKGKDSDWSDSYYFPKLRKESKVYSTPSLKSILLMEEQGPFGNYLFGQERGLPNRRAPEEDTPEEKTLLKTFNSHYQGQMDSLGAKAPALAAMAKKGLYQDILSAPQNTYVYRFMFRIDEQSLSAMTGEQLISVDDIEVFDNASFTPKGRPQASWTIKNDKKHLKDMAMNLHVGSVPHDNFICLCIANTGGPNQGKFILNPDELSKVGDLDFSGIVSFEKEVLSVGGVKLTHLISCGANQVNGGNASKMVDQILEKLYA